MSNLANRLLDIKSRIEEDEQSLKEAEAEHKVLMKQLKDNFDIISIKDAEKEISKLKKEDERLEKEINELFDDIENKYDI